MIVLACPAISAIPARAGGEDLHAWTAAAGWAFAYHEYSLRCIAEKWAAKAAECGIWRGDVVPLWNGRKGARLE